MKKEFIVQPYANEHACRLQEPSKYERFARKELEHEGKKYYAIIGFFKDGGSEVQSYRYPKDVWSEAQAAEHCKEHNGDVFEAAKPDTMQANQYNVDEIWVNNIKYIRLPVIFLKEGVLHGSQGALFHNADVFKNYAEKFNKIPVTFMHPQNEQGNFVSVNEKKDDIIGFLDNVEYDNEIKALRGKVYLDKNLLTAKYQHLLNLIDKNYEIEVSIGTFGDVDDVKGNINNINFEGIVRSYEPDHLAILGEERGACSYEFGCGIRNQETKDIITKNSDDNKINNNEKKEDKKMENEKKKITLNEALEIMEEKDKALINQALTMLSEKKNELISVITNANPTWKKEELENECICKLQKIVDTINNVSKINEKKEADINANKSADVNFAAAPGSVTNPSESKVLTL